MHLKRGEGIRCDVKGRELHVAKEAVEVLGEEDGAGQRLMAQALPQHHPTVQGHLWTLIAGFTHHRH